MRTPSWEHAAYGASNLHITRTERAASSGAQMATRHARSDREMHMDEQGDLHDRGRFPRRLYITYTPSAPPRLFTFISF
jgi:hypothetical protein